jgi:uncharacterized damage-inducible protein DinB
MINLIDELKKAYNGDAWHGNNVLNLLLKTNPQKAFTHPIPNSHSIAELVLHLTAWTEEVTSRLEGTQPKEPLRGDWPEPIEKSEAEWSLIIKDFQKANEKLLDLIQKFPQENAYWNDQSNLGIDTKVNKAQLINGFIQHHAYHSGQIALLQNFNYEKNIDNWCFTRSFQILI